MTKKMIAIRDVDEEVFRRFRAKAVEDKINLGGAVTVAMRQWVEDNRPKKPVQRGVHKIKGRAKPFNWGKGTENTSEEIDEILYGGKK
ncbi:MAG: hypothetical protein HYS53_01380 [Candidatus Aenigmarchaeota archaeon]|nr:hypothetical protein [Candidatus Aenigmarchaeota archaeon]